MASKKIHCKLCDSYFKDMDAFVAHLEKKHYEMIPPEMSAWQFAYNMKTGKQHGSCIICKKPTTFNEVTHKYNRFCLDEKCKQEYIEMFRKRMIGKYGKVHLLNEPTQQKVMLSKRKISGTYTWSDRHHTSVYTGSYEKEFLQFLDLIMNFNPEDVITPSPHTYYYKHLDTDRFYYPDVFIPSLNLEIEIKDGGDNPNMHSHRQGVDAEKEKLKDAIFISNKSSFNYLKIVNKDHTQFFKYLEEVKNQFIQGIEKPIVML